MCFSANSSFASSAVIGSIGILTLRHTQTWRERLMASTPLLFASQQFTEGLIWLKSPVTAASPLPYVYCFFAFILWPTFSPVAAAILEKRTVRKYWFAGFVTVGIITSLYFIQEIWRFPVTVSMTGHHLVYHLGHPIPDTVIVLYCIASVASCFFSSRKWIIHYGWILLVSLIAAYIAYQQAFASTWCFFSAILSTILFIHFSTRPKLEVR